MIWNKDWSKAKVVLACGIALTCVVLMIVAVSAAKENSPLSLIAVNQTNTTDQERAANAAGIAASAVITSFVDQPMCRFGFAVGVNPITTYLTDLASLRAGWYLNFGTSAAPARPNGIEYAQMISVKQLKTINPSYTATYAIPYTYTVNPPLSGIPAIASAAPGSLWFVGNEIERRDWACGGGTATCTQNEILPEVYAEAYHQIYTAIKNADPKAQVANGAPVLVSPLRLKYFDRVWNAYLAQYGTPMPVDAWSIHPYMLRERRNDWGAEIPAGLTETEGVIYENWQNDDLNAFVQQITMFRQWMAGKGEQNKPLVISEFGVIFPTWYRDDRDNYYTPQRVKNFMYGSFDYLLTAKDPSLGYPADDNRLVQRWNWYSLDVDPTVYNGNLFSYTIKSIDLLGLAWKAYVTDTNRPLGPALNLKMLTTDYTLNPVDTSGKLTATVKLQMSNAGFLNWSGPLVVQLSKIDGTLLGQTTLNGLQGCGKITTAAITLTNLDSSVVWFLKAQIDPAQITPDSDFSDNSQTFTLIADPRKTFLPLIKK